MSIEQQLSPQELLRRTLFSPGNKELLEEIRQRAEEILEYFRKKGKVEDDPSGIDPAWLEEVFGAISLKDKECVHREKLAPAPPFQKDREQETEIGRAFTLLLRGLPPSLQDLTQ